MKAKKAKAPRAYTAEEARDLFLQTVANYVDYWEKESRQPELRAKLEGLAFSILVILDGEAASLPGFTVKPLPSVEDKDWYIKQGENYFDSETDIAGSLHDNIHKFLKK
jgi:hypothetical protein